MPTTTNLTTPKALLLDFGGVIATTVSVPGWEESVALKVIDLLSSAGLNPPELSRIVADIQAGRVADSHWKNSKIGRAHV